MTFKQDFLTALSGGNDYHALMELVRRYRVQGLSMDAAYDELQQIWLERGFNDTVAEEGTMQDTLESIMEKVWYGRPAI
jgi:hypothetical protein